MSNNDRTNDVDQANDLKQLFNEVNVNQNQSNHLQEPESKQPKIDVLNLPPRKEVHQDNKKGMHIPLSKPFLRFLSVIIVITGLIFILFYYGDFDFFDLFK